MNKVETYLSQECVDTNLGLEKAANLLRDAVIMVLHDDHAMYTPPDAEVIKERAELLISDSQCLSFLTYSPNDVTRLILEGYLGSCIEIVTASDERDEYITEEVMTDLLIKIAVWAGILIETPEGRRQISSAYLKTATS